MFDRFPVYTFFRHLLPGILPRGYFMNYNEFLQTLRTQLLPLFSEGTSISTQTVVKNNGISQEALIIREPHTNLAPLIYLEDYYRLYTREGASMDELCSIVYDVFLESRLNHPVDANRFTDFEKARNNLIFQVVNYEKNALRLSDLVHIRYLDLAIVFCCLLRMENGQDSTALIHREHLRLWNVDADTVKKQALINTPRLLPAYIQPLTDALRDLVSCNPALNRLLPDSFGRESSSLYVLTNETQTHGASCMFYPSLLQEFAESVSADLYVLPSSIHEVLLLPTNTRNADERLCALVRSVNGSQIPPAQILSDTVYFYSREKAAFIYDRRS